MIIVAAFSTSESVIVLIVVDHGWKNTFDTISSSFTTADELHLILWLSAKITHGYMRVDRNGADAMLCFVFAPYAGDCVVYLLWKSFQIDNCLWKTNTQNRNRVKKEASRNIRKNIKERRKTTDKDTKVDKSLMSDLELFLYEYIRLWWINVWLCTFLLLLLCFFLFYWRYTR